MLKGNTFKQIF